MTTPVIFPPEDCFYTCNGRPVVDLSTLPEGAVVHKHYRLRGGKGGFGSMLRAIGSQIEKTTNHEMCRDLSGRRMRDVNTEAKLKEWYEKASQREREKMEKYFEKRQRRQELLAKGPLPGHKFSDKEYERQKRKIASGLQGALDVAIASILKEKNSATTEPSTSKGEPQTKRSRLWIEGLDEDPFSSSSTSSSSNSDGETGNLDTTSTVSVSCELNEEKQASTSAISPIEEPKGDCSVITESSHSPNKDADQNKAVSSSEPAKVPVQPLSDIQLQEAPDAQSLELFGLDVLKESLNSRGLKCGGTLSERASRLFSVRHLKPEEYPSKLRTKAKSAV